MRIRNDRQRAAPTIVSVLLFCVFRRIARSQIIKLIFKNYFQKIQKTGLASYLKGYDVMATKSMWLYRLIRAGVKLCYPKMQVEGIKNLPDAPALIVANHAQMNGPIACELYFPGNRYTWCAGQMMHLKEVPEYAFQDFWSRKPRRSRWFSSV